MGKKPFALPATFHIHFDGIDEEHQALVDIVNVCQERCIDGKLFEYKGLMSKFIERLELHFEHEEGYMRELGYDGYEWHSEHHRRCVDRAHTLLAACDEKGYADREIVTSLFSDIIDDVARADLKFGEFLEHMNLI